MDKEFFNVKEFAVELEVCEHTVRTMIKSGKLRAFRAGAGVKSPFRIPKSELTRYQVEGMHAMNPNLQIQED